MLLQLTLAAAHIMRWPLSEQPGRERDHGVWLNHSIGTARSSLGCVNNGRMAGTNTQQPGRRLPQCTFVNSACSEASC